MASLRTCLAIFMASLRAYLELFYGLLRGCLGLFCEYYMSHLSMRIKSVVT